jgi:hypothetical protein
MLPSFAGSAISLSRVAITASIRLGLTLPQRVADAQLSSAWHQGRGSRHKAYPDRALELHDLHRTVATGLQRLRTPHPARSCGGGANHISGSRAGIAGVYQRHARAYTHDADPPSDRTTNLNG